MDTDETVPAPLPRPRDQVENRELTSSSSRCQDTVSAEICQSPAVEIEPADGGAIFRLGGRIAAQLDGGVLRKTVKRSRHLYRARCAWCWDRAVLRAAVDLGCTSVQVHDSESGNTYRATMADLRLKGFPVSLGFGEQWGLALSDFGLLTGQPNPFERDRTAPQQLSLLGAA